MNTETTFQGAAEISSSSTKKSINVNKQWKCIRYKASFAEFSVTIFIPQMNTKVFLKKEKAFSFETV